MTKLPARQGKPNSSTTSTGGRTSTDPRRRTRPDSAAAVARGVLLRDIAFTLATGTGFVLVLLREDILPERFLGDEKTIQQLAQRLWETAGDSSYDRVADIYRFFALADAPLVAGLVGFTASVLPYVVIMRAYPWRNSAVALSILVGGILLSSVYLGSYSKELFVVPIVLLVVILPDQKRSFFIIVAAMCSYAVLFRQYWYLSAIVFALFYVVRGTIKSLPILFLLSLVVVFTGSVLFTYVMGVPADHYRASVNVYRESVGDVNTLIERYLDLPEPLGGSINNALTFILLQVPVPLALEGSAYYLGLFLVLTLLWGSFYFALRAGRTHDLDTQDPGLIYRVAVFIQSFVIAQAFFEPDYGSALKHLTPLLPLFLVPWLLAKRPFITDLKSEGNRFVGK